jgi:hypothetical protein
MKGTKLDTARTARRAYILKKEGFSSRQIGQILGISKTWSYKLINKMDLGYYDQPPKKLVKMVAEEVNESAYITVMLFDGDPGENLLLSIPKPKSEEVDEYMLEVQKSVLKRLKWCYAHEGFRFITGV